MIPPSHIPNPYVKPKWQAPVGVMESIVAYNCRKYCMPRPVLAMPMWEGAGNRAIDLSGYGNHGTLTNGAKWVAKGVEFDGTDDCVADTFTGMSNSVATVSCWIYPHTEGEGRSGRIIMLKPSSGWNVIFFDSGGANRLKIGIADAISGVTRTGTNNDITLNAWNHVVYSYDGSAGGTGIKIYVNGSEVTYASTTGANSISAVATNFIIGANNIGGDQAFDGIMENFLVFDTVITASQAKFLYDNPYFMYRMPEELYGYAAASSSIMTQFMKTNVGSHLYNGAMVI